jgi:hypothetical protein
MTRAERNILIGGSALGLVGLAWLLTRGSSPSTPISFTKTPPPTAPIQLKPVAVATTYVLQLPTFQTSLLNIGETVALIPPPDCSDIHVWSYTINGAGLQNIGGLTFLATAANISTVSVLLSGCGKSLTAAFSVNDPAHPLTLHG